MESLGTCGRRTRRCGGCGIPRGLLTPGLGLGLVSNLGDNLVLAGEQPVECHPEVGQQVKAVGNLHRLRCCLLGGLGIGAAAIPADKGDSWMCP